VNYPFNVYIIPIRQEIVLMVTSVHLVPDTQTRFHVRRASSGMTRMAMEEKLVWSCITSLPLSPGLAGHISTSGMMTGAI